MPTQKKKARKKTPARAAKKSTVQRIQDELPAELRAYAKRVQQALSRLEKQIDTAQRDARKRFTRLLRDASHQLGGIEAEGERQWRKRTAGARREAVRLLRRLEQTLETKKKAKPARPAPRKVVARPAPTAAAPKPAAAPPKPAAPAMPRPAAPAMPRPAAPAMPKPAAPAMPKPVVAPPISIQPKPAGSNTPGSGTLPRSGS